MSARRAFEDTEVPADRSKAEIRALLLKYGAVQFGIVEEPGRALVGFVAHGRLVRLEVPLPDRRASATTKAGKYLGSGTAAALKVHDQEERRIWRAVRMWIYAELEAVASGIRSFESLFLADTVLPSGATFGAWAEPQLQQRIAAGEMPALLPARE
jgi:hypothetical protein